MAKVKSSGTYLVSELNKMRHEMRPKPSVTDGILVDKTDGAARFIVYEPGNGTKYKFIITKPGSCESSAEIVATLGQFGMELGDVLVVVFNYNRSFVFNVDINLHYVYIQEKLKCSILDAVVIAELFGSIYNISHVTMEEFLRERTG